MSGGRGSWIPEKARGLVAECFGAGWEEVSPNVLQGHCPGADRHSTPSAAADCRLFLGYGDQGQSPGAYCLHSSCKGVLDGMNQAFREKIFSGMPNKDNRVAGWNEGVAKAPRREVESWIPKYEEARLRGAVRNVPEGIGKEWFMARSAIDPRKVTPGEFLEHVFRPGERAMVFTEFKGPGDFLWEAGRGGYRLAKERGVKAVRSTLPTGGPDGVWYLSNPIDGQWHPNPRQQGKFSRRSAESVTAWRHVVLESDVADHALWLRFLAMVPVPVVAIYSSGGKSWHALVRVDMPDKPAFDTYLRNDAKRVLPVFGADAGAMTPVRLTRLPGCMRGNRLQELIYLRPDAPMTPVEPIITLKPRREIR